MHMFYFLFVVRIGQKAEGKTWLLPLQLLAAVLLVFFSCFFRFVFEFLDLVCILLELAFDYG